MNKLYFEKLSAFDRIKEPCVAAVPLEKGKLFDADLFAVADDDGQVLSQTIPTAFWDDGSVKWVLVHFLADLPANKGKIYYYDLVKEKRNDEFINIFEERNNIVVKTDKITVRLNNKGNIFNLIESDFISFEEDDIIGPVLNEKYYACIEDGWKVLENGSVTAILEAHGRHFDKESNSFFDFTVTLQFFKNKEWFKIDYRIINREDCESSVVRSLRLDFIKKASNEVKFALANSNYKTKFDMGTKDDVLYYKIDAKHIIYEANEHFPEVFYGTFFADWRNENGGICASVYQAYQNYPKALKADKNGISIYIVPENSEIEFLKGIAKSHTLFLQLHSAEESIENINIRALQFQMPDRPFLEQDEYKKTGLFPDIFLSGDEKNADFEGAFIHRADSRARAYGMLNWGDSPDMHYTSQGRGGGDIVWVNNEYDFPHAAMLMYVRFGERRMLDYLIAAARHWMDVDICHCSDDEFRRGGQVIHSAKHASGKVDISHEWVEGLFDYYHMTGDRFAYDCAIEIGNNIKRNLTRERYHNTGQINARETGWALRAFAALYLETNDDCWLEDADFIVGHFKNWKEKYGLWLAPYTDHTAIRVPFMISIAVSSLMRYYEIKPNVEIKNMIIEAVDDMIENCMLDCGLFYYKELPSLRRRGTNTIVLEALVYAFKLTGNKKYLEAGIKTFKTYILDMSGGYGGTKTEKGDAVYTSGTSSKGIAQSFLPTSLFYAYAVRAGFDI